MTVSEEDREGWKSMLLEDPEQAFGLRKKYFFGKADEFSVGECCRVISKSRRVFGRSQSVISNINLSRCDSSKKNLTIKDLILSVTYSHHK